ncbi:MAG: hypothetical protein II998_11075 [Clostridia bacterium]|nr:hypothetical protein [Clostridia bacterium]
MHYRRIVTVFIGLIMIIGSLPVFAVQSESLVSYPQNGMIVDKDFNKIILNIEAGYDINILIDEDIHLSLTSTGNDEIMLSDALCIGKHKLNVVADNQTNVQTQTVNFTVGNSAYIVNTDATEFTSHFQAVSNKNVGKNSSGEDAKLTFKNDFIGPDGGDDKAFGFFVEEIAENTNPGAESYFWYKPLPDVNWVGTVVFEYDLKMLQKGVFELETKSTTEGWGNFGGKEMFRENGKIYGTDYEYPVGEWMHVKHIIDIPGQKESLYIDDDIVLDNVSNTKTANIMQLKFQGYVRTTGSNLGFALDNIHVTHDITIVGIDGIEYVPEGQEEFVTAEKDTILLDTKTIKFNVPVPTMKNVSDISSSVDLYNNGAKIEIKEAIVDENGNIIITLNEPLDGDADFKFGIDAYMSDGTVYRMEKSFSVMTANFGIVDVNYEISGDECILSSQLKSGEDLTALFSLKNLMTDSCKGWLVVTAYDNQRLAAINIKPVSVPAATESWQESVTLNLPVEYDKFHLESSFISDFETCMLLSKLWTLK